MLEWKTSCGYKKRIVATTIAQLCNKEINSESMDWLGCERGVHYIIISHWLAVCIELWQKQHQPEETAKGVGVEQPRRMIHRHTTGGSEILKIRKSACFNSIMLYSSHRGVCISSIICHHQSDPEGRTPLFYMPLEEFFRVTIYTFATILFTN